MPCETVSKLNLVDLAGRYFVVFTHNFHYIAAVILSTVYLPTLTPWA